MSAVAVIGPAPKPIPEGPACCRGCGETLEPLRRWGGLCRACVRELPHKPRERAEWSIVREFTRTRGPRGRIKENMVRVRCSCGKERVMSWSDWVRQRTGCCKRCRLAGFDPGMIGLP